MNKILGRLLVSFSLWILMLAACGTTPPEASQTSGKLKVIATTSIVGDVVSNIGGEVIDLNVLLPLGSDPHSYEPTPQDIASIADAQVVFTNGAGLETFLDSMIATAGGEAKVVEVSQGIELRETHQDEDHAADDDHAHDTQRGDPHVWTDPNNVLIWVGNIEKALSAVDPENAALYRANAQKYTEQLKQLDAWIRQQIAQIPPEHRQLLSDHLIFGYLADEYGLTQVGAVIPGYSTLAQPSAQELAQIEDIIRQSGVQAVFVGQTVNWRVTEQVAADTGAQLVMLYTGSLSLEGGEAGTYLDYMRYNVSAIVEALK